MDSLPPIPAPVLTAPGIRLRPFRPDDASWVYYVSLDPEIRRRLSLPEPYRREHARWFVDEIAIAGEGADFVIEESATRTALGWVGLHRDEQADLTCGFWLAADARGHGIMTSALRLACRWAMAPLPDGLAANTIRWEAHVGNDASRAVAEKAGFTIHPGTIPGTHGPKWSGHLLATRTEAAAARSAEAAGAGSAEAAGAGSAEVGGAGFAAVDATGPDVAGPDVAGPDVAGAGTGHLDAAGTDVAEAGADGARPAAEVVDDRAV
jgi:RimJ/RimL family protein N-acetyltransferase